MLEKQFSLIKKPCYALAGPVDYKVKNIYKQLQGYSCDSRIKDNDPIRFLFISNGSKSKGTDLFFNIVFQCFKKNLNFTFTWVTNQKDLSTFGNTSTLFEHKYLTLLKPLPKKELVKTFLEHDCLLFLSPLEVGYGQISLEALLCDMPVLFFNSNGDLLNLIGSAKSYDSGDAQHIFTKISRDRDQLKKYAVSNFPLEMSLNHLKPKTLDLFGSIIK